MLKGTIYITNDINLCMANLNTCRTIVVADEPDVFNIPGKIGGSILLPPYEALAALVDYDNDSIFKYEYLKYLSTNITVTKFIDIILQALLVGTNIIFLVDHEGPNFTEELKEFFMGNFGIYLGDKSHQFQYDITYMPVILSRLYANDSIDRDYFLRLFPQEVVFDSFTIGKLMYDSKINFNNGADAITYFKKISLVLKNGGKIQGVVKRLE